MTSPNTSTLPDPNTSAGRPVEGAPVHVQPQIAFALRRESADRRAVEGQVVIALDQEFLVIVEHVQTAFQVAEQHRDGLDALLIGQVLQPFFLDLVRRERGSSAAPSPGDSTPPARHKKGVRNLASRSRLHLLKCLERKIPENPADGVSAERSLPFWTANYLSGNGFANRLSLSGHFEKLMEAVNATFDRAARWPARSWPPGPSRAAPESPSDTAVCPWEIPRSA